MSYKIKIQFRLNDINVKTFLEEYDIDEETKEIIAHKNAEKLLKT